MPDVPAISMSFTLEFRCHHSKCSVLHPFSGYVELENDQESALSFSYLKIVNGKCVDRESNTLVISFLEISSTRSETAVVHKNTICISLYTWNKECMS